MSTTHLPEALTPTRLDASQGAEPLLSAPFDKTQGRVYPSMYPLPGSSHPPLASPPNATLAAFPSFIPGVYSAGGVDYFPNYQGHSIIYPPVGFIPPMEDPAPPMDDANFQAPSYPFYDMPAGTATCTTALLPSGDTGHHEQPTQFTFKCPFPTQPEAAAVQDQQQGLYEVQDAQENFVVKQPPREPGEVHSEDYQIHEEPHAALVEPEVRLYSDQWNNSSHPLAKNTMVHSCSNNPKTACSGRGMICLDILCAFVGEHPDVLSAEQIAEYFIAAIAPESNAGLSTAGQLSQVDTNDLLLSQYGAASWEMASSGSSTTGSTSTSAHSSPSGSCLYPPNHFEATSSSMGSVSSSTGKRQRSEDYLEDRPKKQRREQCTDTRGDLKDRCEPCENRALDGREKCRKKKKSTDEREFICLICMILGEPCQPLSRRDSLKRHISKLHDIFQILFRVDYREFKILEPRRINQSEDLRPLIALCITVQSQARERGVEIKEEHDLKRLYPDVAASMNHS